MTRTALRGLFALPLLTALLAAGCTPKDQPAAEPDKPKEQAKDKAAFSTEQEQRPVIAADSKKGQRILEPPTAPVLEEWIDAFRTPSPTTVAMVGGSVIVPVTHNWGREIDLTNPDLGLDSELQAAVEVDKEKPLNVDAPVVEGDPIGLPNIESGIGLLALPSGSLSGPGAIGGGLAMHALKGTGVMMGFGTGDGVTMGIGTGGSALALPGYWGRSGATKEKLLHQGGGNDQTEAAVGRALSWLAKQQNIGSGFWEFDGAQKGDRIAATGMCLLPFLAAGETHKSAKRYKETVGRGLKYLNVQMKPNGEFSSGMYAQAIATMAVCEAYGMTRDESQKRAARAAVDYIVRAQAGDGSWGYTAGSRGDTSITGWQIQALAAARLAQLQVPQKTFDQAALFLESVSGDAGATYGYRTIGRTHTLTAAGLLSRYFIGWKPDNPSLQKGVAFLVEDHLPADTDFTMYYYYYGSQIMYVAGGKPWERDWNPKMSKLLLDKQITEKTPGAKAGDIGSFPADSGFIGKCGGKLGTTALACLTLEVYYRHLPPRKPENPPNEKK